MVGYQLEGCGREVYLSRRGQGLGWSGRLLVAGRLLNYSAFFDFI